MLGLLYQRFIVIEWKKIKIPSVNVSPPERVKKRPDVCMEPGYGDWAYIS